MINLKKNDRFNLTKREPGLKKIIIGLGWEPAAAGLDLDASIFMTAANGKIPQDECFIFYNNKKSPDGSIIHEGDNRTGAGEGDDERILANLDLISPNITEIVIAVSINEAFQRNHRFGLLSDAYVRLLDFDTKRVVAQYDLDAEFADSTEVIFGKLERQDNEWIFVAVGLGSQIGLEGLVNKYA